MDYPELPEPFDDLDAHKKCNPPDLFTADQMQAYVDADRAQRAAPGVQGGEPPQLVFDKTHINYIDRYGGFCRDCADEDGVCPSSGLPCGGSKKAIRHVLTALAYGVNHGYIPVILCAAPTTTKDAS